MFDYNQYLPLYLREIRELRALGDAADLPAWNVYHYTVQKYLNQFIRSADAPTLARWEAILQMNGSGLDIDERRKRIILRFCLRSPITVKTLEEIVEEFAGVRCDISLNYPKYSMTLALYQPAAEADLKFLYNEIYTLKPANITFTMQEWTKQNGKASVQIGVVPIVSTQVFVPPASAVGSRKAADIKVGCLCVEYTKLVIGPSDNISTRRRETRVAVTLARMETTQIKIPA